MTTHHDLRFADQTKYSLGRLTSLMVMLQHDPEMCSVIDKEMKSRGYRYTVGKVGAMELTKVIAAIETCGKSNQIVDAHSYHEIHSLYHAIIEALQGVGRGTIQFGEILRTVGLTFCIARGNVEISGQVGEWLSVFIYGTIGAPQKGFEHDVLGFGYNHI